MWNVKCKKAFSNKQISRANQVDPISIHCENSYKKVIQYNPLQIGLIYNAGIQITTEYLNTSPILLLNVHKIRNSTE